jgi:hypothetical protein
VEEMGHKNTEHKVEEAIYCPIHFTGNRYAKPIEILG